MEKNELERLLREGRPVRLAILVDCPRCASGVAVNRLCASVRCLACAHEIELAPSAWALLDGSIRRAANGVEVGGSSIAADLRFRVTINPGAPVCGGCGSTLAPGSLTVGQATVVAGVSATGPALACSGCATPLSWRPVPEWFVNEVNGCSALVIDESGTPRPHSGKELVSLSCMTCGAPLGWDGSSRQIPCVHCSNTNIVPPEIWARIGGVRPTRPWHLLIDLAGADHLRTYHNRIVDLVPLADQRSLVAYYAKDGRAHHNARIGLLDRNERFHQVTTAVGFGGMTRLVPVPGEDRGEVLLQSKKLGHYLVDEQDGTPGLQWLDPETVTAGQQLPEDGAGGNDEEGLEHAINNEVGLSVDRDGSILIAVRSPSPRRLLRFDRRGQRMRLWESAPRADLSSDFFARGPGEPDLEPDPGSLGDPRKIVPGWERLPYRIEVLPDRARFCIAPDGRLVLLHEQGTALARYDRTGSLVEARSLAGVPGEIRRIAAGHDGAVYALFNHDKKFDGYKRTHLARILPDAEIEVWLGPHASHHRTVLGLHGQETLRIARDGTVHLANQYGMRSVAPTGELVWLCHFSRPYQRADHETIEAYWSQRGGSS